MVWFGENLDEQVVTYRPPSSSFFGGVNLKLSLQN